MSHKSQERNMRRLAGLLGQELSYIWGGKESGPNGAKKQFLNTGRTFLRALGKDLGLRDVNVRTSPGGIAISGSCSLIGMWKENGIYIQISQSSFGSGFDVLYRTVRHKEDYTGGHNCWLTRHDLARMSYRQFLDTLLMLRKEDTSYERAA